MFAFEFLSFLNCWLVIILSPRKQNTHTKKRNGHEFNKCAIDALFVSNAIVPLLLLFIWFLFFRRLLLLLRPLTHSIQFYKNRIRARVDVIKVSRMCASLHFFSSQYVYNILLLSVTQFFFCLQLKQWLTITFVVVVVLIAIALW